MAKNIVIDRHTRKWCVVSVSNKLSKKNLCISYETEFFETRRDAYHYAETYTRTYGVICHVYKRKSCFAPILRCIADWFSGQL